MLVKEGSGEAVHYPYLCHLWAGHPPSQGQPFDNVNAASVGEQLSRLLRKKSNTASAPRPSVPHTKPQQQRQQAPTSTTKATTQHQQRHPPTSAAATTRCTHPAPAATTSRTQPTPAATPIHPQQHQPTAPATQRPAPQAFTNPKAVRSKILNKRIAVSPGTAASPTHSHQPPPTFAAANHHHLPPPPPHNTMHLPHPTISHPSRQLQQAIASAPAKAASDLAARLAAAEAEISCLRTTAAQPTNK